MKGNLEEGVEDRTWPVLQKTKKNAKKGHKKVKKRQKKNEKKYQNTYFEINTHVLMLIYIYIPPTF